MNSLILFLPVRTQSESNLHGHWRGQWRRSKVQRTLTFCELTSHMDKPRVLIWSVIKITRVSPRQLDDDNLRGALKAIRDGISDWFTGAYNQSNRKGGINDRDTRLTWDYDQQKGKPKEHGVLIAIDWEEEDA